MESRKGLVSSGALRANKFVAAFFLFRCGVEKNFRAGAISIPLVSRQASKYNKVFNETAFLLTGHQINYQGNYWHRSQYDFVEDIIRVVMPEEQNDQEK